MSELENPQEIWDVRFASAAKKQKKKIPQEVSEQLISLLWDLEHHGPTQPEWSHYGPLKKGPGIPADAYHCHIKSGRPTYVVCWYIVNKQNKRMEIFYVGTHENSPY